MNFKTLFSSSAILLVLSTGCTSKQEITTTAYTASDANQAKKEAIQATLNTYFQNKNDYITKKTPNLLTSNWVSNIISQKTKQLLEAERIASKYTNHATSVKIEYDKSKEITTNILQIPVIETIEYTTNEVDKFTNKPITVGVIQSSIITLEKIQETYKISAVKINEPDIDGSFTFADDEPNTLHIQPSYAIETDQEQAIDKYSFDKQYAVDYAFLYLSTSNTFYPDFTAQGGDCTNFASQCMKAAGWPYVYGSVNNYNKWWFGQNANPTGYRTGFSSTWPSANKFYLFLSRTASRATAKTAASSLVPGDIVSVRYPSDENNTQLSTRVGHTMVVTSVSATEVYVSYHTATGYIVRRNRALSEMKQAIKTHYNGNEAQMYYWQTR